MRELNAGLTSESALPFVVAVTAVFPSQLCKVRAVVPHLTMLSSPLNSVLHSVLVTVPSASACTMAVSVIAVSQASALGESGGGSSLAVGTVVDPKRRLISSKNLHVSGGASCLS